MSTVGIIVPVYNVENYIDRCMESIVNQTYGNIEIILVDDGSTDRSHEICEQWCKLDSRIRLITQKNQGLGPARNIGIKKSSSDYILFVDSDDWIEKTAVQKLLECAEKFDADIVNMDFFFCEWDEVRKSWRERIYAQPEKIATYTNAKDNPNILFQADARMWSRMFKRRLFIENDLYMPAHPYEDFPVTWILLALAGRVSQVREPLYHYICGRKGSICTNIENVSYVATGIQELKDGLIERELYLDNEEHFKEYVFYLSKISIDDIDKKISDKYIRERMKKPFWSILREEIPKSLALVEKSYYLIGSRATYIILKRFLFLPQIKRSLWVDNQRNSKLESLYEFGDGDTILVDFLDCCYLKNTNNNEITKEVESIARQINEKRLHNKVILIELNYAAQYGVYPDELKEYENIDSIDQMNAMVKKMNHYFISLLDGEIKRINIEIENCYTYQYTAGGCLPVFYNGRYYKEAANILKEEIANA